MLMKTWLHTAMVLTIALTLLIAAPACELISTAMHLDDSSAEAIEVSGAARLDRQPDCPWAGDRLWFIDTNMMTSEICRANLESSRFLRLSVGSPGTRLEIDS